MKKVYLIYAKIPSVLYDSKMHEHVNDNSKYKLTDNYYIGLYAWTTDKLLLDNFLEFRKGACKIYKIKIREFTKNEYDAFKNENKYEKLSYYIIPSNDNEIYNFDDLKIKPSKINSLNTKNIVVCTKQELEDTIEYGPQCLYEYMAQIINAEYLMFKDEYKLALDYLGYCDEFNIIYRDYAEDSNDTFYFDRSELTEHLRSYRLTHYGNPYTDIYSNRFAIFISIFYEMIVGYNDDKEVKLLIYR